MNDQKHIIEVCCTGNSGRSTQAEVIGNYYANELNLDDVLLFISSGTRADPKYDNILPYEKVVSVLNSASSYGLMKQVDVDKDRYENDSGYRVAIQDEVHMAFKIMRPIEAALRNSALYKMNMKYDGTRTQTVLRNDVSLILGMTQKHVSQVNEIYSSFEQKPLITTITEYAGVSGEIPNALGNPNPIAYIKIRDKLLEVMPKVIERFGNEFL